MKAKEILILILILAIVIIMIVGIALYIRYVRIAEICDLIRAEQTEKATAQILRMPDVNIYSLPLWLRPICLALETDIELPLVEACKTGNLEIVKLLLEKGADPNKFLKGNWSPLEAVFISGSARRLEIAEILVEYGADVDLYGNRQSALFIELKALMYSQNWSEEKKRESTNCILFLLKNGASLIDLQGNTVVHYLSYAGCTDALVLILKDYDGFISYQNKNGQTPLMWAASSGEINSVKFLVKQGVQISVVDCFGNSALDYARRNENVEIIEFLESSTGDGSVC